MIDKACSHVLSTRRFLFYMKVFLYSCSNPYISNKSNLYNPVQNSSVTSKMICDHMFSDTNLDYKFHFFGLRTCILYIFSHMCQLSTYFEYRKVLESNISLLLSESNRLQTGYYFLLNKKPNSKYFLDNYFEIA